MIRSARTRSGRFLRSLYARIALAYVISLLLLCGAAVWFTLMRANDFSSEMAQRLDLKLADNLAMTMAAGLARGADSPAARATAEHILTINPSLSLYLLDAQGKVVAAYDRQRCGLGQQVPLAPLHALLHGQGMLPILAHAPCSGRKTVFSVAPVGYGKGQRGFLYIVLNGEHYASLSAMFRTSYVVRGLLVAGALSLLFAVAVGLAWFAFLTRRFGTLTRAVEGFASGDHSARAPESTDDEIGDLGSAFNSMAATIEAQLEALHETDRLRRELVANVSHDFRTPLTSLRGHAEQSLARVDDLAPADAEVQRMHLRAILDNADRLTRLAAQLATLARLDAYEQPLRAESFSLVELIQDIIVKFGPEASQHGVTLEAPSQPNTPPVIADIGLIDRLLSNLIENALHATDSGGHVVVETLADADGVSVSVVDDGRGISANELPLVTQRFYRTRRDRDAGKGGSGLGLSIVREILERHGTRLNLESTPGRGTAARFTLPTR